MSDGMYDYVYDVKKRLAEKDQQIADLEAKLAESEKKILELQVDSIRDNQIYNEELAEKDKLLEYFRDRIGKADREIKEMYKNYNKVVEDYNNLKEEVDCNFVDGKDSNHKKISFAVEQLEKVKGRMQHRILFNSGEDYLNVIQQIDNKIKQLKEGK